MKFRHVFLSWLLVSTPAMAGGGVAGSTEFTQILNNIQLLKQVSLQSAQVAQEVRQTITQAAQYAALLQNLKQAPAAVLGAVVKPYKDQARDLKTIYSAVDALRQSSVEAEQMLQGHYQTAAAMQMTPRQFLEWEMKQSRNRQDHYSKKLTQEMKALQNMQGRYEALQAAQQAVPGIDAQVNGLQQLNTVTGMAVGELMDMRAAMQTAQVESTQRRIEEEASRRRSMELLDAEHRARMDALDAMDREFDRMMGK